MKKDCKRCDGTGLLYYISAESMKYMKDLFYAYEWCICVREELEELTQH